MILIIALTQVVIFLFICLSSRHSPHVYLCILNKSVLVIHVTCRFYSLNKSLNVRLLTLVYSHIDSFISSQLVMLTYISCMFWYYCKFCTLKMSLFLYLHYLHFVHYHRIKLSVQLISIMLIDSQWSIIFHTLSSHKALRKAQATFYSETDYNLQWNVLFSANIANISYEKIIHTLHSTINKTSWFQTYTDNNYNLDFSM